MVLRLEPVPAGRALPGLTSRPPPPRDREEPRVPPGRCTEQEEPRTAQRTNLFLERLARSPRKPNRVGSARVAPNRVSDHPHSYCAPEPRSSARVPAHARSTKPCTDPAQSVRAPGQGTWTPPDCTRRRHHPSSPHMTLPTRPTGTVTFLFTDIEGSTKLLHVLGDRYVRALAEHRRLLRNVFAAHSGFEVDTQGDAFFYALLVRRPR